MSNLVLITGTDTGVGKTFFTTQLIKALRAKDVSFQVCKPIETGCRREDDQSLVGSDIELLANARGVAPAEVSLYTYESPVAPAVAELVEKPPIDLEKIRDHLTNLSDDGELTIVEGAGGLLVPISGNYTFADLAKDLDMRVIVVFGSKLGAINHAALTFETLKNRNILNLGYVYNEMSNTSSSTTPTNASQSNHELLNTVGLKYGVKELCYLPFINDKQTVSAKLGIKGIDDLTDEILKSK